MNRLRYLGLVALLLAALLGPPTAYLYAVHHQAQSQARTICQAVNRVNGGLVRTWDYIEGRVKAARPGDKGAIDLFEHLKTLAPQGTCK